MGEQSQRNFASIRGKLVLGSPMDMSILNTVQMATDDSLLCITAWSWLLRYDLRAPWENVTISRIRQSEWSFLIGVAALLMLLGIMLLGLALLFGLGNGDIVALLLLVVFSAALTTGMLGTLAAVFLRKPGIQIRVFDGKSRYSLQLLFKNKERREEVLEQILPLCDSHRRTHRSNPPSLVRFVTKPLYRIGNTLFILCIFSVFLIYTVWAWERIPNSAWSYAASTLPIWIYAAILVAQLVVFLQETPEYRRARSLFLNGRFSEAKELLLANDNERPRDASSLGLLFYYYLIAWDFDKAAEIAEKACRLRHSGGIVARKTLREYLWSRGIQFTGAKIGDLAVNEFQRECLDRLRRVADETGHMLDVEAVAGKEEVYIRAGIQEANIEIWIYEEGAEAYRENDDQSTSGRSYERWDFDSPSQLIEKFITTVRSLLQ